MKYSVEFNWIMTKYGARPYEIRFFDSQDKAEEFAETCTDSVIEVWEEV